MNLEFSQWLVVLSGLIVIVGSSAYIRDTIKGKTKPNRISWLMWSIAPLIGAGAAISSDADIWVTIRILLSGLLPLIVLLASFLNKKSHWKLTGFDFACGVSSVIALIFWWIVGNPELAILLAALGDGFASLPTIRKAWKFPETETGLTFMAGLFASLIVIPSIPVWDIENSAFLLYLIISNSLLLIAIYRKPVMKFFLQK